MQQADNNSALRLLAVIALALLHACCCIDASAQTPRRPPTKAVPAEELLPPATVPRTAPPTALPRSLPYEGPPATIDGPDITPQQPRIIGSPPEIILPPGGIADDALPYVDGSIESEIGPFLDESEYFIAERGLTEYRDGFFQKIAASGAWIGSGNDSDELGVTEVDTFLTVAVPFPIVEWPLLISPGYNMRFFDGPPDSDIPPRVHEAYVDFMWLPLVVHRWRLLLAVTPGVFSDFNNSDSESFRVNGKSLVIYDYVPDRLQVVGGVLWLNRDNLPLLPAGGVIWTPRDWLRMELIFPKPKAAARFNVGEGFEDWLYVMAEYGGNSWAVERTGGEHDVLSYSDYRIVTGYERRLNGGAGYRIESGYVFGRDLQYRSGDGDFEPTSAFMIRGGVTF